MSSVSISATMSTAPTIRAMPRERRAEVLSSLSEPSAVPVSSRSEVVARVIGPLQVVSAEVTAAGRDARQDVLIAPVYDVTRTVSDWKAAQANQNASWCASARSRCPSGGP